MDPNQPQGMQQFQQPQTAAQLKRRTPLWMIITLVLFVLLFFGASGFGIWAFMERGKFKNDTDKIVAKEVALTEKRVSTAKDAEFVEAEKRPTKGYKGPATFGSVELEYPKTWAAFITESDKTSTPIDGYLHPDYVPGVKSGTSFALRIELEQKSYDNELKNLDSKVRSGKISVTPFRADKVPHILGARIQGEINQGQKNLMVMFPIRDKTLKISTQSEIFFKDFDAIILKTLTFAP